MQSLVSKTADTSHYDFETANWYDKDVIKGKKIVVEAVEANFGLTLKKYIFQLLIWRNCIVT